MQTSQLWLSADQHWIRSVQDLMPEVRSATSWKSTSDRDIRRRLRSFETRSVEVIPDFVCVLPPTATHNIVMIAGEFLRASLNEQEREACVLLYADTLMDGLVLIDSNEIGVDHFFELSGDIKSGIRKLYQPQESSTRHESFVNWSRMLQQRYPINNEN